MVQKIQNLKNKNLSLFKNKILNIAIEKSDNWLEEKEKLGKYVLELLYDCGAIKTWYRNKKEGWTLNSKLWSPVYISLRDISSKKNGAELLELIGKSLSKLIINEIPKYDKILGLATTGIQIATVITIFSKIPSLYTRKIEAAKDIKNFEKFIKKYGEHKLIEGEFDNDDIIIIVDDLVTKFDTVVRNKKNLHYIAQKKNKKVICNDVVVLIDREQGADLMAKKEQMILHSLIPFKSKLHLLKDKLAEEEYQIIKEYFEDDSKFQEIEKINEVISLAK
ncbi:MAG: hypothetical protein ACFFAN_07220 [Promethearchaeota archaeon]